MNDAFYLMVIPEIEKKINEFEPLDLVSITFGALRPEIKKNEVKRQLFSLSLKIIENLATRISQSNDEKEVSEAKKAYLQVIKITKRIAFKDDMKMYNYYCITPRELLKLVRSHKLDLMSLEAQFGMLQIQ